MQKGFKVLTHRTTPLSVLPCTECSRWEVACVPFWGGSPHPTGLSREKMEGLISSLAHPGARLGAAASLLHCTCKQAGFGFPRWWAVLTVGSNAGRARGQWDILEVQSLGSRYHQRHEPAGFTARSCALVLQANWGWRAHWGKEVAESLLCPWQHEHTTASCGAEGSL